MVKFRRSRQGEKGESKSPSISIPHKDAIAIIPPKKVIRALYDYTPDNPSPGSGYLAFSAGDFLHVVGREDDEDWYEACNPLQNTRGLVPVKYFNVISKNTRDSGGSQISHARQSGSNHDSGYGESSNSPPSMTMSGGLGGLPSSMGGSRLSKTTRTKVSGATVYGEVMYDFKAERPDELDAKEGEAIIIIAQSNPEWFVAKPITRLGGPGLIPVTFIEIKDMATGKPVTDPLEAVQRAGVPKVEEWKKMAADYKNGSIPLGKLDANQSQGLEGGMARMSLQSPQGQQGFNQNPYGQQQQPQAQAHPQPQYPAQQSPQPYQQQTYGGYAAQPPVAQFPQQQPMLAPIKASVPQYCFAEDIFWFIVEAQMEDGRHWELQRLYQDFYDLQINLIQEFPREAGTIPGHERSLPFMPGPVTYVTDNISNMRRANLDEYIRNLLKLGQHITNGYLVRKFFAPRDNDHEIDPNVADTYRLSASSQHSGSGGGLSNSVSQQSSVGNLSGATPYSAQAQQPSGYPAHQRNQSSMSQQQHLMSPPPPPPPGMPRQHSNMSGSSLPGASGGSGTPATQPTKIKIRFSEEEAVIIRMPPVGHFRFQDLYKKLKERRMLDYGGGGAEELTVTWRDEMQGRVVRVDGDEPLNRALQSAGGGRLVLDVRVTR